MDADQPRAAGRKRDPRTDAAAAEAVLDLIGSGATLSGLSLVTIAEHAGVSRNSLYRRWATKDDLYFDVLGSILQPLPESEQPSTREEMAAILEALLQRTMDPRASSMLRALLAEARIFPELHRRYFEEIVGPRRESMYRVIRHGIDRGELRPDLDIEFVNEVLVAPIIMRMATAQIEDLDPEVTSRRIVDLLYAGIAAS